MDDLQFTFEYGIPRFSAYNKYYCHDAGCRFQLIFMKFTWLVRDHIWVNPIVFENNQPSRTIDMEENVPPKSVFLSFNQPAWAFLRKKFQNGFRSE